MASIGEALYGVFFFLMECPPDAGDDLESADGAGEGRAFLQVAHESFPGGGAVFPGEGVVLWADDRHDTIADEGHGCKVSPAFGVHEHDVTCWVRALRVASCCLWVGCAGRRI
jgi:hypothetical protein